MKLQAKQRVLLRKEKIIPLRSKNWSHFTKIINSESASKAECNYCKNEFCCDGKKWYGVIKISYRFMELRGGG
ncbi:hypothetical protein Goshw_012069 [Gossypium schwendimanii]|uniref:BED-type domain-containing protein n=1 Tax=Gossypium schwendimanii TaxID=34291 RepID=A0A7J9LM73_GOSSC|nr:hypothetical protein [Gossypium schwendimanii]